MRNATKLVNSGMEVGTTIKGTVRAGFTVPGFSRNMNQNSRTELNPQNGWDGGDVRIEYFALPRSLSDSSLSGLVKCKCLAPPPGLEFSGETPARISPIMFARSNTLFHPE